MNKKYVSGPLPRRATCPSEQPALGLLTLCEFALDCASSARELMDRLHLA